MTPRLNGQCMLVGGGSADADNRGQQLCILNELAVN